MGLISTGPGSPLAFSAASGGKVYAFNAINVTTQTIVAPANTSRQKITFHNPGVNDILIIPQNVQTTGSDVANSVTTANLGGALRVYGNGGTLVIEGECQGAWHALAALGGGATNPLTVIDSNV